jgi:CheY-like chemotaxis protein
MGVPRSARPRVVILESDDVLRGVIREVLEDVGGYRVDARRGGEEAHRLIRETRPDAVVVDPGPLIGPGLGPLDRLGGDPQTRHIPIVVCSGGAPATEGAPQPGGRIRTVGKPFGIDELLEAVSAAVGGPAPS